MSRTVATTAAAYQVVARRLLSPIHRGVRYELTPYGRTLGPVFQVLWQWSTTHLRRHDAAKGTLVKPPRLADGVKAVTP